LAFTACLASFLFTATAAGDVARFDILDVGQGDAILVTSPEGKTLLVDAGPSGQVVNLLSERNVSAIDLAVLSHHHFDHYGGMDDVIRRFKVRNLLMTNSPHSTLRFRSLLRLIRDQDIRVLNPTEELRTLDRKSTRLNSSH
jgi:beta-lactamase superfamily II metal-dependent hydrolase